MKIINKKSFFKILLIFALAFFTSIFFNTKTYAVKYTLPYIKVFYNNKEIQPNKVYTLPILHTPIKWSISSFKKGQYVGSTQSRWTIVNYDKNIIKIIEDRSTYGGIRITPQKVGQTNIVISNDANVIQTYKINVTQSPSQAPYLSVKYNGNELKRDTPLNLSMKYKNKPIRWDINSNTSWEAFSTDTKVISVDESHKSQGYLLIKPLSYTVKGGLATLRISTKDHRINHNYIIQVKQIPSTLSVKYNRKEVEKGKFLTLPMGKSVNWSIKSTPNWKVYSKDNSVINISINRQQGNSGYITITPISNTVNGGQATILIYTNNNEIINTYRIQVKADPNSSPSHSAPKNLIIRPESEVDYTYKGKNNTTPMPTVFIKQDTSQDWTVGSKVSGVGEWDVSSPNIGIIQVIRKKINTSTYANYLKIKTSKKTRRNNYKIYR